MSLDSYFGVEKPEEKKEILVKPTLSPVIFEPKAVYEGENKKFYTFDESLRALRKCGYERHPRPSEVFDLICRGLEGKLSAEEKVVVDDMQREYGEWFSLAVLLKGNMLHCYLDPENLVYNGRWYVIQGKKLKYSEEKVFAVVGLYCGYNHLRKVYKVNPLLAEFLWSRHYAILPEEIRQKALIYFPPKDVLGPVARGSLGNYYISTNYNNAASRGITLKK